MTWIILPALVAAWLVVEVATSRERELRTTRALLRQAIAERELLERMGGE